MEKVNEILPNYLNNLEDKIVELSLKLKSKENELTTYKKEELELFKIFIHNLKNPLGNVNAFSAMILENRENVDSVKQQKYLGVINDASNFSLKLMNTFSDYFTLKNSNKVFEKTRINLHLAISKEVEILKKLAFERNIILEIIETTEDVYINTNESGIRKIMNNLVHNAIRFSEDNTKISIEAFQDSEKIEIRIIDQGIGISKENLTKILNEFFVCSTYDVAKIKCIGLGLSISKIQTAYLNGKLKIKSELNKGTTVSLSFNK